MKATYAKQYPASASTASIRKQMRPNLSIHRCPKPTTSTFPDIREVYSGICQQLTLLRSVSKSIILLGIGCEILLCLCMIPIEETLGTFSGIVCCICGLLIALMSLFHAFCICAAIWEISDEMKKLK